HGPIGPGQYSFNAVYSGDANYVGSTSACEPFTVAELTLVKTDNLNPAKYDHVGQVVTYNYLVTNTGGSSLAGPVTITDDKIGSLSCPNVNTVGNLNAFLDPGESITCHGSYTITQADLDSGSVLNHATAHAGGTDSNQAQDTISADQHFILAVT